MEKNFEIESFLSQEEVNMVLEFYNVLPKHLNTGKTKKAYTTGFDLEDIPVENFTARLKNVLGDFKVTTAMILEEFVPWSVHTDYFKPDTTPFYAVLIPLDYKDKNTHTIIFDQLGNKKDWQENLKEDLNYKYNSNESKLLSHIDKDILNKLTVDKIYKWQKGNMIAWHRNYLHSSDNFVEGGLDRKIALVLFLNND